jgi:hypothetical protein
MKLYAGTPSSSGPMRNHRIAEKLRAEYTAQPGTGRRRPKWPAGRTASWRFRCSSTKPNSTTTA